MKENRDFSQGIMGFNGEVVRMGAFASARSVITVLNKLDLAQEVRDTIAQAINAEFGEPVTLCDICVSALRTPYDDEKNLLPKERLERFDLALRIHKSGVVEITHDERDLLKRLVGKFCMDHMVYGVTIMMLEGKNPFEVPAEITPKKV